ncbi:hypothetical protein ACHZ97_14210 [Lysobacter soli]|uniref:hypothetical protein n=1 Tax=Lysobacter soli TaxID=453783 RepID=UPI0037C6A0D3
MQAGHDLLRADHPDHFLQGDVYENVPCVTLTEGGAEIAPRRVMLISNSCDVDPTNRRDMPIDVTVAPVLRLERYRQMLLENGAQERAANDAIRSIKSQEKSNVVYLPAGGRLAEDMVALLDQVQSMPFDVFNADAPPRQAVLTQRGFWLLLLKLSVHFLRPHEGVGRDATPEQTPL